jgi:hypothetical protein
VLLLLLLRIWYLKCFRGRDAKGPPIV